MKIKQKILLMGILWIGLHTIIHAGTMGLNQINQQGILYIGGFGGGGWAQSADLVQQGTALYNYDSAHVYLNNAGPLAVNAFGQSNGAGTWIAGAQIGYRFPEHQLNHFKLDWIIIPAVELEGYYLGRSILRGDDINNATDRLVEHNFQVTYPISSGVFLVNALMNTKMSPLGGLHPYIGFGGGVAGISISGANSLQTTPLEAGVNHYNSDTNDMSIALAAQPKIGVSLPLSDGINMFLEYRFLYLSQTNYTFGSTQYPSHVATTNWNVKIGSQYFNIATAGAQFDI